MHGENHPLGPITATRESVDVADQLIWRGQSRQLFVVKKGGCVDGLGASEGREGQDDEERHESDEKEGRVPGAQGHFPMAHAASPLVWRFSQVFGDKAGEGEIAEGLLAGS